MLSLGDWARARNALGRAGVRWASACNARAGAGGWQGLECGSCNKLKTDNWGPHGGGNGHIISAREFVVG